MGTGKKLWGWYKEGVPPIWVPLQVDVDGKVVVDMSAINLDDLADVSVAAPADGDLFYYDDATGLWKSKAHVDLATGVHGLGANSFAGVLTSGQFLQFNTASHVFLMRNVGPTPHTSNIVAIAGSTVTVTAGHGTKFFNPYMIGASYAHLWNTTRGTDAWIQSSDGTHALPGDILTLTANVPAGWQVGDALLASYDGVSEYMEFDCSPGVSANTSGGYVEMSVMETGAFSAASTFVLIAGGGQAPTIWSLVLDRISTIYAFAPFVVDQKLRVRLRAGAATSILACNFYIYAEIHELTEAS